MYIFERKIRSFKETKAVCAPSRGSMQTKATASPSSHRWCSASDLTSQVAAGWRRSLTQMQGQWILLLGTARWWYKTERRPKYVIRKPRGRGTAELPLLKHSAARHWSGLFQGNILLIHDGVGKRALDKTFAQQNINVMQWRPGITEISDFHWIPLYNNLFQNRPLNTLICCSFCSIWEHPLLRALRGVNFSPRLIYGAR